MTEITACPLPSLAPAVSASVPLRCRRTCHSEPLLAACAEGLGGSTASTNKFTIGFVSPRTGATAGFGEPDAYVLDLARKAFAGGLEIPSAGTVRFDGADITAVPAHRRVALGIVLEGAAADLSRDEVTEAYFGLPGAQNAVRGDGGVKTTALNGRDA